MMPLRLVRSTPLAIPGSQPERVGIRPEQRRPLVQLVRLIAEIPRRQHEHGALCGEVAGHPDEQEAVHGTASRVQAVLTIRAGIVQPGVAHRKYFGQMVNPACDRFARVAVRDIRHAA